MPGDRARRAARRERKAIEAEEKARQQKLTDEKYMRQAIRQAGKAAALGEVPIGCVIVYEDRIIGRGYNRRNTDKSTFSHGLHHQERQYPALLFSFPFIISLNIFVIDE